MFSTGMSLQAEPRSDRSETKLESRADAKEKSAAPKDASSAPRTFDDFLRLINECNTVVDAKRIRHQILAEYSKKEGQIRTAFQFFATVD